MSNVLFDEEDSAMEDEARALADRPGEPVRESGRNAIRGIVLAALGKAVPSPEFVDALTDGLIAAIAPEQSERAEVHETRWSELWTRVNEWDMRDPFFPARVLDLMAEIESEIPVASAVSIPFVQEVGVQDPESTLTVGSPSDKPAGSVGAEKKQKGGDANDSEAAEQHSRPEHVAPGAGSPEPVPEEPTELQERYAKMGDTKWFRAAHEGKSLGVPEQPAGDKERLKNLNPNHEHRSGRDRRRKLRRTLTCEKGHLWDADSMGEDCTECAALAVTPASTETSVQEENDD